MADVIRSLEDQQYVTEWIKFDTMEQESRETIIYSQPIYEDTFSTADTPISQAHGYILTRIAEPLNNTTKDETIVYAIYQSRLIRAHLLSIYQTHRSYPTSTIDLHLDQFMRLGTPYTSLTELMLLAQNDGNENWINCLESHGVARVVSEDLTNVEAAAASLDII